MIRILIVLFALSMILGIAVAQGTKTPPTTSTATAGKRALVPIVQQLE